MVVAGLLFVDNTDVFAYAKTITTHPNKVIVELQLAVLTWQAAGGALKPEKCSWSLLAYCFAKGRLYPHAPLAPRQNILIHCGWTHSNQMGTSNKGNHSSRHGASAEWQDETPS
jgi:hypothetical protein